MTDRTTRALCFDIDGTLAMMDQDTGTYVALPGAVDALTQARAKSWPVVAYTNGTFFPPAHYYPKLADAGIHIDPGHVLTPAVVAAVIGDDPKLEILMGRRAGALSIGVTTGFSDEAGFNAWSEDERAQIVLPGLEGLMERLGA